MCSVCVQCVCVCSVCVCCKTAVPARLGPVQCKDEEAVVVVWLPWLISHSIETIWVTLIWGPLHALYNTLYTLYRYCTVTWRHGRLEKYMNMDRCTELILVQSAVSSLQSAVSSLHTVHTAQAVHSHTARGTLL